MLKTRYSSAHAVFYYFLGLKVCSQFFSWRIWVLAVFSGLEARCGKVRVDEVAPGRNIYYQPVATGLALHV